MRTALLLIGILAPALAACFNRATVERIEAEGAVEAPAAFDHGLLTALLSDHVDEVGRVDYPALRADSACLNRYLRRLAATDPARLAPSDALAFWINAYNAYTLKLVVDNYPVGSILDVVGGPFVPGVNSPFGVRFATVGGRVITLDDIEHGVIRARFAEPRIHFAVVCAAVSCPPLRAEAYEGARLDAQLDDQARRFLHDPTKNRVTAVRADLSMLFDWYEGDLGGSDAGVLRFIAPYFDGAVREALEAARPRVAYLDYDWGLNSRPVP